jgi:hypothetical protein
MLRHTAATLAYRGRKVIQGVGEEFARFHAGGTTRTPVEILAHIGDLLDWALSMARGRPAWHDTEPRSWQNEAERFFEGLKAFETYLASDAPLMAEPERLFQGPVADALTHVGQIAILRRLASAPIRGENYYAADITTGVVGPEQAPPRKEFD